MCMDSYKVIYIYIDRERYRQTDRQMDRQIDRQTAIEREREPFPQLEGKRPRTPFIGQNDAGVSTVMLSDLPPRTQDGIARVDHSNRASPLPPVLRSSNAPGHIPQVASSQCVPSDEHT